MRTARAVVGKPSTPTPLGRFFVEESIALRASDAGDGLDNVGGTLGTAVFHGCVRLADAMMRWLVTRIGPGTPVTVTR